MLSRLNLIAFCGVLAYNVMFWTMLFAAPASLPARSDEGARILKQSVGLLLMAWALAGSIVFIVDAFRRPHTGSRSIPIGLAISGVITFGLISVLYYVLFGRYSIRPSSEVYGSTFCRACLAQTTGETAPDTFMGNFIGTILIGEADRCEQCRSRSQTLWFFLFIPLFPVASYRVIATDAGGYLGRRTRLNLRQVAWTYAIGLGLAGTMVWLLVNSLKTS